MMFIKSSIHIAIKQLSILGYILIILLLNTSIVNAQVDSPISDLDYLENEDSVTTVVNYNDKSSEDYHSEIDTSNIEIPPIVFQKKSLSQSQWNSIVSNDDYKYTIKQEASKEIDPKDLNWLQRFIENFILFFDSNLGIAIIIILALGLIGFVIYQFLKRRNIRFGIQKFNNNLPSNNVFEDIPTDWEQAIQDAIKSQNYTAAIAYKFRHLLLQMNENEIIKYTDYKTNTNYFYEIKNRDLANNFRKLTTIFNEAKYSYLKINEQRFSDFITAEHQFKSTAQI